MARRGPDPGTPGSGPQIQIAVFFEPVAIPRRTPELPGDFQESRLASSGPQGSQGASQMIAKRCTPLQGSQNGCSRSSPNGPGTPLAPVEFEGSPMSDFGRFQESTGDPGSAGNAVLRGILQPHEFC